MKSANRLDQNAKWLKAQFHTLEDGEICYVWHEHSARIRDMDNEILLRGVKVDKAIGQHYVMYKRRK